MKVKELIKILELFDKEAYIAVGSDPHWYDESHVSSHGPIWTLAQGSRVKIGIFCGDKPNGILTMVDGKIAGPDQYYDYSAE